VRSSREEVRNVREGEKPEEGRGEGAEAVDFRE